MNIRKKPKVPIAIRILSKKCPFTERALKRFVRRVLAEIKKPDYGVSVYVVGRRRMKSLHKKYFKDPRDTDCISFSQYEGRFLPGADVLGDVFVSWDQVRHQAAQFHNTPRAELLYCVIHGILHLIGHDDSSPKARRKMFLLQDRIHRKITHVYSKNRSDRT